MESRLFCSSSHLGSAAAPLSSLVSASGDSRKWQTHADGSRKVSTTTSPDSSRARSFSVLKFCLQMVRPSPAGESRSLTQTPPGVEHTVI